jgi:transcriptional regulator with XRE-family HTH domain
MRERIIEIRREVGLKQGEFAKRLGIKQSVLSNIETGQNGITDANIRLICMTFNVNEDWLRHGIGDMFISLARSSYETELLETYRSLLPATQKVVLNNVKDLLKAQNSILASSENMLATPPAREDTITTSVKNPDITIKKRDPAPENEAGGAAG